MLWQLMMANKGFFKVFRDPENPNDIHFQQIDLSDDEKIPEEQLKLRDDVDNAKTTIRMLFANEQGKFEEYFKSLLALAQLGLVGSSANPDLATRALSSLKQEILIREGGRIKNQYMRELGKVSLVFGLPALLLGVVFDLYINKADSTMKCNFCKEVYRQAAVVSELLKRPSKRSTDEALQAAHQGATIPDFRFEESGIEPIANCG